MQADFWGFEIGGSSSVLAFLICFSKPCFLEAFLLAGGSGPSWALLVALPRFRPRLQDARSGISGDIVGVGRACPGAIRNANSDEAEVPSPVSIMLLAIQIAIM